jgi:hypothetical protein
MRRSCAPPAALSKPLDALPCVIVNDRPDRGQAERGLAVFLADPARIAIHEIRSELSMLRYYHCRFAAAVSNAALIHSNPGEAHA